MTKKYLCEDSNSLSRSVVYLFTYEKTICKVRSCSRPLRLQYLVEDGLTLQPCGGTIAKKLTQWVHLQLSNRLLNKLLIYIILISASCATYVNTTNNGSTK